MRVTYDVLIHDQIILPKLIGFWRFTVIRLIPPVFSKAVIIPIILPALAAKCFNPSSASEKNNKSNTARLVCTFSDEYVTQYSGLRHVSVSVCRSRALSEASLFACSWKTLCPECKSCSGIRVCFTEREHAGMVLSASGYIMTTCFTAEKPLVSAELICLFLHLSQV